jgi:hypothetical protein
MPNLITVPTFTFDQGDPFDQDPTSERPIHVLYYSGTIALEQNGEQVLISPAHFEKLVKAIRKHLPEATKALK